MANKINLTEEVSGALPVANGGTGVATLTGLVKASGTSNFAAAVAGTDYCAATSGSSVLKGSSGSTTAATAGTDYSVPTGTETLTNKRITKRTSSTSAPGATPSMNTDNFDLFIFTGLAAAITSMTTNLTGTPVDGDQLLIRFTDNATARAITWGAKFGSSGVATLLATTVISKVHTVGLMWDATKSLWICLAVDATGY